jgi:methyl-accepting chemotaxis protein
MKLFAHFTIKQKLPLIIAGFSTLAAIAIGWTGYLIAKQGLAESATDRIAALQQSRAGALERYLGDIENDLLIQDEDLTVISALNDLSTAFRTFEPNAMSALHKLYITENPNPVGQKDNYDAAPDKSNYSAAHAKYHPYFHRFQKEREYYDLFLIDQHGNVVYSVFKELDFASNVLDGRWSGTAFSKVASAALSGRRHQIFFSDFAPYEPSNNVPASFIATPVVTPDGKVVGAIAYQMPVGRINSIMQDQSGFGETGEAYIVGNDKLMRSDSRFSKDSTILSREINTPAVAEALAGRRGSGVFGDGAEAGIVAYSSLDFNGVTWAILASEKLSEVEVPALRMRNTMAAVTMGMSLVIAVLGISVATGLTNPIAAITGAMTILSQGRTDVTIPGRDRKDEIGAMSSALEEFKDNVVEIKRMQSETETKRQDEEKKRERLAELTRRFEHNVTSVIQAVSAAAVELQASAEAMSKIAQATTKQTEIVSSSASQTSQNVQTVAASTEELAASIDEIRRQVDETSQTAKQGVSQAEETNATVHGLQEAASQISEVVGLITEIASQTNLLALNATIEASRAGEAGRGFAVVASEVKSLAHQTQKATEQIDRHIGSIQIATERSVKALNGIASVIGRVEQSATSITAAVEQQTSATREISRNVQDVASGTGQVSDTIGVVNRAAHETGNAAAQVLEAAQRMSLEAETLNREVQNFLTEVRAA